MDQVMVRSVSLDAPPPTVVPHDLRILLVERHEVARRGLDEMLRCLRLVAHARSVGSIDEAARSLDEEPADILVLTSDIGESETNALLEKVPEGLHLLLLIRSDGPSSLAAATRTPATGFVMESELTMESLEEALVDVGTGHMHMPSKLAEHLLSEARKRPGTDAARSLTGRERQVLTLLTDGLSNKEIARKLNISTNGAKQHVSTVLAKLNCSNRTIAATRAVSEGLLDRAGRP